MCSSKKEKDNFGRLCWVLIEVGSLVLTEIFNKVCLPENLDVDLKDNANRCKLESLRKKRILSVSQWSKLYPVDESSPVSSRDFDTSLQLILLRSIYGLNLPASGQNDFPPATDTSPVAGITCMKVLRDRIHHHDTSGSVDDPTFSSYWFDIKEIFMRFGGYWYLDTINRLEFDCLDEDLAEDYQKQLREWLRDDAFMKDKLEGRIVKKARKDEDMEGLIGISKQISGREEIKLYQHAHGGAAENAKISPPDPGSYISNISDLPEKCSDWVNVKLPIDIVLFTVDEVVFLSCFTYLKNPIKSYNKDAGMIVYFSSMEDKQGHKINIALMRCFKDHDGPGGALSTAKDAISLLKPKALFFVSTCSGLKSTTSKLGDVVLSSKVITRAYQIPPRRNIISIINYIPDGWRDPLRNPNGCKAKIHVGSFLSIPEANNDIIRKYPEAIGLDNNAGGFCTAAHDSDTEWLIVMGIESFVNDIQSSNNNWKEIASVRAASVGAKVLSDMLIFQDWPHSNAVPSPCSAATTASASKPLCT